MSLIGMTIADAVWALYLASTTASQNSHVCISFSTFGFDRALMDQKRVGRCIYFLVTRRARHLPGTGVVYYAEKNIPDRASADTVLVHPVPNLWDLISADMYGFYDGINEAILSLETRMAQELGIAKEIVNFITHGQRIRVINVSVIKIHHSLGGKLQIDIEDEFAPII